MPPWRNSSFDTRTGPTLNSRSPRETTRIGRVHVATRRFTAASCAINIPVNTRERGVPGYRTPLRRLTAFNERNFTSETRTARTYVPIGRRFSTISSTITRNGCTIFYNFPDTELFVATFDDGRSISSETRF